MKPLCHPTCIKDARKPVHHRPPPPITFLRQLRLAARVEIAEIELADADDSQSSDSSTVSYRQRAATFLPSQAEEVESAGFPMRSTIEKSQKLYCLAVSEFGPYDPSALIQQKCV